MLKIRHIAKPKTVSSNFRKTHILKTSTVILISYFILFSQIHYGQDSRVLKIERLCDSLHKVNEFNGNILIAEKGNIIFKKSFGLANESTKQPLNENSIFDLASVSKPFTAMAIVVLKENGKLNYDDKMSKYIPELSNYDNVTVRHLLNHTSGLPDYFEIMDTVFDKSKIATNSDIINIFAKLKPHVLFEPNTKWEYSNTGYALLASIIEKVSGMSYGDYLHQIIFKPLEMTNSFVYNRRMSPKQIDNYAFGYIYTDSLKRNILPDSLAETKYVYWLDGIVGDGTVNSTTTDLLKWDRALYTNKLCSQASVKEVFKPVTLLDETKSYYGLGWFIDLNKDYGTIVKHKGGWPGYVTFIDRHIDNDKTIIILQNTDRGNLPMQTLRVILYNKNIPTTKTRLEIKLPEDILKQYIGVYEFDKDNTITYFIVDGELKAQSIHQPAFTVFAETETKFFHKVVDAQQEFIKDKDNKVYKLIFSQGGQTIEAKKIK